MFNKINTILKIFAVYLSVCGIFGFSMFIMEESQQVVMFSTWQSIDCNDWPTVKASIVMMEGFNKTLNFINYSGGWLNPLCFLSYRAYYKATAQYIHALRSKALAHAPELFVGEKVTLTIVPRSATPVEGGFWELRAGKLLILSMDGSLSERVVSGTLVSDQSRLVLDAR